MTSSGSFSSIIFFILRVLDVKNSVRFVAILRSIYMACVVLVYGSKNMSMLMHLVSWHWIWFRINYMRCYRLNDNEQSANPVRSKPQAD